MIFTDKHTPLLSAFSQAVHPTEKEDIFTWTPKNVRLKKSQYSNTASFDYTPWFKDPVKAIYSDDWDKVHIVAGTGAGKSTMLEILMAYDVAFGSGDILYATQNDGNAATFNRDRLQPTLSRTLATRALMNSLPEKEITKEYINFPHLKIHTVGANMSSFQEISVQKVLLDECWCFNSNNLIGEAEKRLHDRHDGKMVNVSQAGSQEGKGSEWYNVAKQGLRMDYAWTCECGVVNNWDLADVKFEKVLNDEDEVQWQQTFDTIRLECPTCKKTYEDKPQDRWGLLERSVFQNYDNNYFPRNITFFINSLAFPKIRWSKVVGDFIRANESAKAGNISPMIQLKNKVFSEFTKQQSRDIDASPLTLSDYRKDEIGDPPVGTKRIMTVDVQGGGDSDQYYWSVIRDWEADGSSRLVFESMIANKEQIKEIASKYKVTPTRLFLDSGYETEVVLEWCAEFGCYALNGKHVESYTHIVKRKEVVKLYSQPTPRLYKGKRTHSFTYAGDPVKDILAHLKDGAGVTWELPADLSKNYKRHLNAEEKQKNKAGKWKWSEVDNGHNHLLDCEVMQIVAAMIHGVYPS